MLCCDVVANAPKCLLLLCDVTNQPASDKNCAMRLTMFAAEAMPLALQRTAQHATAGSLTL
eukprot:8917707-Pyramimonas_sp.AAC.1